MWANLVNTLKIERDKQQSIYSAMLWHSNVVLLSLDLNKMHISSLSNYVQKDVIREKLSTFSIKFDGRGCEMVMTGRTQIMHKNLLTYVMKNFGSRISQEGRRRRHHKEKWILNSMTFGSIKWNSPRKCQRHC